VINVDNTPEDLEELLRPLSPTGDLLDLARVMRELGVESLIFAGSDGRISTVVTDRQIAHLAAAPPNSASVTGRRRQARSVEEPAASTPAAQVPSQQPAPNGSAVAANGAQVRSQPG